MAGERPTVGIKNKDPEQGEIIAGSGAKKNKKKGKSGLLHEE